MVVGNMEKWLILPPNTWGVGNNMFATDYEENLYVRLILYLKMFWGLWTGFCIWICIGFCFMLAGWAVWLLLLSFPVISIPFISFHSISSHFIFFHFIPSHLSCPFRRWNESALECGKIKPGKESKKKEEGEEEPKEKPESMSGWISWLAAFHHWGSSVAS